MDTSFGRICYEEETKTRKTEKLPGTNDCFRIQRLCYETTKKANIDFERKEGS